MNRTQYTIQTFTMNANAFEDRLRLDAVDAGGIYQAIWITRRLADRFLPHLGKHAEKQVQPGLPRQIVLSMNQEQLRSERANNPTPPVKAQPAITPWLCRTVHLKEQGTGLVWTMTDDNSIDAHMILAANNVRALLDVFLNNYRKLEWGEEAFPDWVREAANPPEVDKASLN